MVQVKIITFQLFYFLAFLFLELELSKTVDSGTRQWTQITKWLFKKKYSLYCNHCNALECNFSYFFLQRILILIL